MKSDSIVMMITLIVSLIALAMSVVNFMDSQQFWSMSMAGNSVRNARNPRTPKNSATDAAIINMFNPNAVAAAPDTSFTPGTHNDANTDTHVEVTTNENVTPTPKKPVAVNDNVKPADKPAPAPAPVVVVQEPPPVAPSLDYIQKFEERVAILKMKADQAKSLQDKGIASDWKVWMDRLQYDEGRLALLRLKAGKRANPTYVETLLQRQLQDKMMEPQRKMEAKGMVGIDSIELKLKFNELEISMMEQMNRMTEKNVKRAAEIVKNYPASPLSDKDLMRLISYEP